MPRSSPVPWGRCLSRNCRANRRRRCHKNVRPGRRMFFAPAPNNANEAPQSQKRLLAVDDSSDSAELIARIGTGCGYEAQFVTDPRALLQILDDWKPDVLTLDLCMPDRDGFSVLGTL